MGKEVTESVVATIEVPTEAAKEVEIKQEVGSGGDTGKGNDNLHR